MKKEDLTIKKCQEVWDAVRECRVCQKKVYKTFRTWHSSRGIYFKLREKTSNCRHCGTCESCKNLKSCKEKYKKSIEIRDYAREKFKEVSETMESILDDWVKLPNDDEF